MIRFALTAACILSLTACAQQPQIPAAPGARTSPVHPETTRNALLFAGGDIGAQVNAALEDCQRQCTVRVPAGNYTFSNTVHLPLMHMGGYLLDLDPAAVLTYTGSGDAIRLPSNGLSRANVIIRGGQLIGTAKAQVGIHTFPTNKVTVREMTIRGFAHGDGIRIEGTNTVLLEDNDITQNQNGVHLIGTHCANARDAVGDLVCGPQARGEGYAPNAVHVISNMIVENAGWGVWEDWSPGVTQALDNLYIGNNLEHNGGAIWLAFSYATQVIANYFEAGPHYIYVGGGPQSPSVGVAIRGNYFTSDPNQPISINLIHSEDAMIEDNSQFGFAGSPPPCFVDLGTETGTYLGKNHTVARSMICRGGKPASLPPSFVALSSLARFVGAVATSGSGADTLPVPGLTSNGHCAAVAANAQAAALTGVYAEPQQGAVSVHYPRQSGGKLNILCSFD